MNFQNKLAWNLGSVHKINIVLEATSPLNTYTIITIQHLCQSLVRKV